MKLKKIINVRITSKSNKKNRPSGWFLYALLCHHTHHLGRAARAVEARLVLRFVLHYAGSRGIERIVAPHTDVYARKVLTAPLADNNLTGANRFVMIFLHAQSLSG